MPHGRWTARRSPLRIALIAAAAPHAHHGPRKWLDILRVYADRCYKWCKYARPDLRLRELGVIHQYRRRLAKARKDASYAVLFAADRAPLVTVRIATWNRAAILCERTLPSVLAQTYRHLEVLVVGAHCTDDTPERVRALGDPRIRFVNLPERGRYPEEPSARWMVAGTAPMNYALGEARGEWLAPLDDDDEFTPDHVATLLDACRRARAELTFGIARMELPSGEWRDVGTLPLRRDHVCHSAVFYWTGLRFIPHDIASWKLGEPGDWNLWRRMQRSGVRITHLPKAVAIHHLERSQWGR